MSLQRVLTNLIDNAVDASGRKGRINIKTVESPGEAGEAPGVIIEITDDGAGIPPEILPKIFDLFVTTKAAGEGTDWGQPFAKRSSRRMAATLKFRARLERARPYKFSYRRIRNAKTSPTPKYRRDSLQFSYSSRLPRKATSDLVTASFFVQPKAAGLTSVKRRQGYVEA